MEVLGIDIGGSGIKGAPVDINKGEFTQERFRVETPELSTPLNVAQAVNTVIQHFNWTGMVGVGFPAIIKNGFALSAANIDKSWIETNVEEILSRISGCEISVINDADAAGLAEMRFGENYHNEEVVLFLTVGTGIGTALFHQGVLLPNTELGHLELRGKDAEQYCSDAVRKRKGFTRLQWAARFNDYLIHIEKLFSPNLILLGGGSSKKFYKFKDAFTLKTKILPAGLLNNAGIIGAAVYAYEKKEIK